MSLQTWPAWPVRLWHAHEMRGLWEGERLEDVEKKLSVLGCSNVAVPLLQPCVIARR